MPAWDLAAADLLAPGLPDLQRLVPVGNWAVVAPQGQGWAGDAPLLCAIVLVMLVVQGGGGTILLADRVHCGRVPELADVAGPDRDGERARNLRQAIEHVVDQDRGCRGDELLRRWLGGGEERPDPEAQAKVAVGPGERLPGGDDVQNGQPGDRLGVIQRHPVGTARAAVVADDAELAEAKLLHELELLTS